MRELKGCPFCGEKPSVYDMVVSKGKVTKLSVTCHRCWSDITINPNMIYHMDGFTFPDGDAIDVWNSRKG